MSGRETEVGDNSAIAEDNLHEIVRVAVEFANLAGAEVALALGRMTHISCLGCFDS